MMPSIFTSKYLHIFIFLNIFFITQPVSAEKFQTADIIKKISSMKNGKTQTIQIPKGTYHFYEKDALIREYYISNHDQDNPKKVGIELENLKNITIDGQGSSFIFHGRMIPVAMINCENVKLKNFTIDFELPALRQFKVLNIDKDKNEMLAKFEAGSNFKIENNKLIIEGEGYTLTPGAAMGFRKDKKLTYKRADIGFNPKSMIQIGKDSLLIQGWNQTQWANTDERFVLRSYYRPTPGIFLYKNKNTTIENVKVHYAEGMGLIAQMCENITLDKFGVCLKGKDDPRYFTTQADATHFSGCKGKIISKNGLYEGMADDAINVHGTYLKVVKRLNNNTLQARYMHPQTWGFLWGEPGDSVQIVESEKMEIIGNNILKIKSIKAVDRISEFGAKIFEIEFHEEIPAEITENGKFGLENLTWTPEVIFANNIVRNNRARGALFSTPKKVLCENNIFDHTHGTAILLCGDCNGWYETGACKDVTIRNNQFINALTAQYQFTNAVISIYPEIPNLQQQKKFFHSGIVIENNTFEMFDRPVLYAKSTDGIIFRNNIIKQNNDFQPFHWNKYIFSFEKVKNISIKNNQFDEKLDISKDILLKYSEEVIEF